MLSLIMTALLLPMTSFAQQTSDDFFRVGDEFNGTRDVAAWTITNNGIGQSETPVGSGLLILGTIGAGYAIAKRKRNKKGAALLLALALTLGFTQCKKKVVEPISSVTGGTTYHISVPAGDGSKVVVNPVGGGTYATVGFEDGDVIYVGYNNAYVGTITYNGAVGKKCFEGDIITSIVGEQPLHLYLLGGKGFTVNRDGNAATVVISDQSSKYPVVSYSPTTTNFTGSGSYEATLHNKCSIMKFNVATGTNYANDPIRMTGMHNKVTVDFATPEASENGFSYSVNSTDGGLIKMPAVSEGITWAIVLPQDALAEGTAGSAYTNGYKGNRPAISKIERNHYYAGDGIAMTINTESNIINLSTVYENWTAENGWTLTGTLSGNYKITIADGATVTLDNISINYPSGSYYKSGFAGITCLGDATIILKDGTTNNVAAMDYQYPGIQVGPSGKTLTIQGTGTLNARYRDDNNLHSYGCGIGGGKDLSCGNIVINGGIINAVAFNKAAGIGSGWGFSQPVSCGTITINGGTVTATGGAYAAGIGTGYAEGSNNSCGAISINGGTVTATGGQNAAGIGTGYSVSYKTNSCGTITISGGSITANGGESGAGIGSGNGGNCGDITISGGTVTATGGASSAGIGSGNAGRCSNITITNTVTKVVATKGDNSAPESIGRGYNCVSCGTVTIGGVEGAITESPYTYTPTPTPSVPSGAINGLFSVSSTKQVWFSQGNLQATYNGSAWSWAFATNQYDYIGDGGSATVGNEMVTGTSPFISGSGTVDFFGWSTNATYYGIHNSANYTPYGGGDFVDWGATMGSGWFTLTSAEWAYLFNTRTTGGTVGTTSQARYAHATIRTDVNSGVNGIILFPDGVDIANSTDYFTTLGTVNGTSAWGTKCTSAQWTALEGKGCVFLPAAGDRNGSTVNYAGSYGFYWSSSPNSTNRAYDVYFYSGNLNSQDNSGRYIGLSVRLVKDAD